MIKTLRASGARLQADVVVGSNQYGGDVAVQVQLNRDDPEVAEALAPLQALLTTRANEGIEDSVVERRVQAEVRQRVPKTLAAERKRMAADAEARVASVLERVRRLLNQPEISVTDRSLLVRLVDQNLSTPAEDSRPTTAEAASA